MDLFKKQKYKFMIIVTISVAIITLAAFGVYFGTTYASAMAKIDDSLDKALEAPTLNDAIPFSKQCIVIEKDSSGNIRTRGEFRYSDIISKQIINETLSVQNGKFEISGYNFEVKSKETNGTTTYAVYDYSNYYESIIDMSIRLSILFCCIVIIALILSYLGSNYMLRPVSDALKKQRDLVANASHELKTPLTVINTNLDVIKSNPDSTINDNDKWMESIDTQITRMQSLITNMLELSKLEQTSLPMQPLDFSEIVDGACLQFEPICFEKGKELITDIAPSLFINGEKDSLERLVIILIDNAIKYSGENGKIGINLTNTKKNAVLTVMNTGDAISEEDAKHVFDRFYRSDGARKNQDNNSFGLGLAIAAQTVQSHNGTISCHGVDQKGTVFVVNIPLKRK